MAKSHKLPAQLAMVVHFAVAHQPDGAVLVGNRLVSSRDVDNRQSCACHPGVVVNVETCVVRPPVYQLLRHQR
jgi:hypothetical protein